MLKKAKLATRSIFFICGVALSSWGPMIPYVKDRLLLNDADLGLMLLIFGIGALLIMPITGWLVDKYGSKTITRLASYLLGILISLLPFANNVYSLSFMLLIFGASLGAINVAINTHGIAVEALANRPLMSGFHCLFSVGGLSGALLMTILLKTGLKISTSANIISALIITLTFLNTKHLLKQKKDVINSEIKKSFSLPEARILCLGVLCFIMFLSEGAMLDWSAVFLNSRENYDLAIAGIGYAVFSIAMAIGRGFGDKITEYLGKETVIQLGSLMAASGLTIVLSVDWHYVELIGFFLIGLGASNIVPAIFSAAGSNTTSSYALTVVTTFGYTGILLGPAIIGFIAEVTTLKFALACLVVLLIFVSIISKSTTISEQSLERLN